MRCDLHVHSRYSGRAEVPVLEHVGRECYSDPADVRRPRPCERAKPSSFDVEPLGWLAADRFSFPSGHALVGLLIGASVWLALLR